MNRMSIYAATAAALLSTGAVAQQMNTTTPPAAATMAPVTFINQQAANQHLASDLIGMTVYGAGDENLGEINDLLVDRNGTILAAVIGVGGFLGVGEKNVAVPFQAVEVARVEKGKERLVLRKTKDELKAAPTFAKYEAAPATTGSVTRPAAPPAAPATAR